jgi:6-phosphogluconate dehydrogenase (decarboxylating)
VRSWLLDLTARALAEDHELSTLKGYVDDSGEGRWTIQEAIERACRFPSSRRRCSRASDRARTTRLRSGCWRRFAISSADMP